MEIKVLYNITSGRCTQIQDYKVTKKRIKVTFSNHTELWKQDSYDAKTRLFFEADSKENLLNKIEDYLNVVLDKELSQLDEINLENVLELKVGIGDYAVGVYCKYPTGREQYSISIVGPEPGIIERKINKLENYIGKIIKTSKFYKRHFNEYSKWREKAMSLSSEFDKKMSYNYRALCSGMSESIYSKVAGSYLNIKKLSKMVPDEVILGEGHYYTLSADKNADCGNSSYNFCITIPDKCYITDGMPRYGSDYEELWLSPAELLMINPNIRFLPNESNKKTGLRAVVFWNNNVYIARNKDDGGYQYMDLGNFQYNVYIDELSRMITNKNNFNFEIGKLRISMDRDFILDQLKVENFYGIERVAFKCDTSDGKENINYKIEESVHLHILLIKAIKCYLGSKDYNSWMLMSELL